jgi:hypothetical protein
LSCRGQLGLRGVRDLADALGLGDERSATRRSSFAFASVVSIRSCVIRFAARLRSIARRLEVSRPNCLPAFL